MANKYQAAGMVCFLVSFWVCRTIFLFGGSSLPWIFLKIFGGIFALVLSAIGGIYVFLATQKMSKYDTLLPALVRFLITYVLHFISGRRLKLLRSSCEDPRKAQERCLAEIIKLNKNTEYGVKFDLKDIISLEDFQTKRPLTNYEEYEQYVKRIGRGEKNILSALEVTRLGLSSGTTGANKWIPMNLNKYYMGILTSVAIITESFPDVQPMQKMLRFHCNARIRKSECGIPIAGAMIIEPALAKQFVVYSSPPEAYLIENKEVAFYIHLLFGLREKELGMSMALFSSMFVDGVKYLEKHWPRLVEDLAHGTLNPDLDLALETRASLEKALGSGDPERADEVRKECEKGQQGIIKRLWPEMRLISTVDNIGIRHDVMKTIGEGVSVCTPLYVSTEMIFGLNINNSREGVEDFLLNLLDGIFEFIPEEDIGKDNPKTLLIDEVEKGRNYEMIITTYNGLYRYRVGDVIQVTGFYRNCPMVRFMYRIGMLLNMFGEKVDQVTISESLNSALSEWTDVSPLRHYCVAESNLLSSVLEQSNDSSHYVFFLEMENADETMSQEIDLSLLAQRIDENIYSRHGFYRVFKDNGAIAPSTVHLMKTGSFDKLRSHILANSSATEIQFKMPKRLRTKAMAEVMIENILK